MIPLRKTLASLLVAVSAAAWAGCDDKGSSAPEVRRGASGGGGGAGENGSDSDAPSIEPARFLAGHTDGVVGVAFSPDSKRIVTASADGTARVWDVATAKEQMRLVGHAGAVRAAAFSDDGTRIATAGADGVVMAWDAETGELLAILEGHGRGMVLDVAFLPNGSLVSVGQDATLRRWDVDSEQQLGAVQADSAQAFCVATSADGTKIATGGDSGAIIVWDADTGKPLWREMQPADGDQEQAVRDKQRRQGKAPAGDAQGKEGGDDATAGGPPAGRRPSVLRVAFSADGTRLFSQMNYGYLSEWDAQTGAYLRHLEPYVPALALDVSGDGRHLFIVIQHGPWVFDPKTLKVTAKLVPEGLSPSERVHRAAISPDGKTAAVGQGGGWSGNQWRRATEMRVPIWDLSGVGK